MARQVSVTGFAELWAVCGSLTLGLASLASLPTLAFAEAAAVGVAADKPADVRIINRRTVSKTTAPDPYAPVKPKGKSGAKAKVKDGTATAAPKAKKQRPSNTAERARSERRRRAAKRLRERAKRKEGVETSETVVSRAVPRREQPTRSSPPPSANDRSARLAPPPAGAVGPINRPPAAERRFDDRGSDRNAGNGARGGGDNAFASRGGGPWDEPRSDAWNPDDNDRFDRRRDGYGNAEDGPRDYASRRDWPPAAGRALPGERRRRFDDWWPEGRGRFADGRRPWRHCRQLAWNCRDGFRPACFRWREACAR